LTVEQTGDSGGVDVLRLQRQMGVAVDINVLIARRCGNGWNAIGV
jgi:hypothetical protein